MMELSDGGELVIGLACFCSVTKPACDGRMDGHTELSCMAIERCSIS